MSLKKKIPISRCSSKLIPGQTTGPSSRSAHKEGPHPMHSGCWVIASRSMPQTTSFWNSMMQSKKPGSTTKPTHSRLSTYSHITGNTMDSRRTSTRSDFGTTKRFSTTLALHTRQPIGLGRMSRLRLKNLRIPAREFTGLQLL